jgi:hypothetical protein
MLTLIALNVLFALNARLFTFLCFNASSDNFSHLRKTSLNQHAIRPIQFAANESTFPYRFSN